MKHSQDSSQARTMKIFAVLVLHSIVTVALALPAFAGREVESFRQLVSAPSLIRVEGLLTCPMEAENNGQPCTLKLQEAKTGKIFELSRASKAMRLYQDGIKTVSIEGAPAANNQLAIVRVNAL